MKISHPAFLKDSSRSLESRAIAAAYLRNSAHSRVRWPCRLQQLHQVRQLPQHRLETKFLFVQGTIVQIRKPINIIQFASSSFNCTTVALQSFDAQYISNLVV